MDIKIIKNMQNMWKNNAYKRISIDRKVARQVSSIIDVDRCSCRGFVEGQINKRLKRSRSIHQVSRSYRGDRSFLDWSTRCREAVGITIRKSWRSSTDNKVSRRYRGGVEPPFKTNFSRVKNTDMNAIQHVTQPMIQSTQ